MFTLLAWRDFKPEQLTDQLVALTDQILWADKSSPELIGVVRAAELFDSVLPSIFVEHRIPVLQMVTLLLGNLKTQQTVDYILGGDLSRCILLFDSREDE